MFLCFHSSVCLALDGIHTLNAVYASLAHCFALPDMLAAEGVPTPENYSNAQKQHGDENYYKAKGH